MLMVKSAEGFEQHISVGWSVCGGIRACVIDQDQIVMRRPADHPNGYGILCLDCYPALTVTDNSIDEATPIDDLPMLKGPHVVDGWHTRNVGSTGSAVPYS